MHWGFGVLVLPEIGCYKAPFVPYWTGNDYLWIVKDTAYKSNDAQAACRRCRQSEKYLTGSMTPHHKRNLQTELRSCVKELNGTVTEVSAGLEGNPTNIRRGYRMTMWFLKARAYSDKVTWPVRSIWNTLPLEVEQSYD